MALWTKQQAAEELGVKVSTLDNWRWRGIGPSYVSLPKAVRYDPTVIQQFIADRTRQPSVQAFMEERRGSL